MSDGLDLRVGDLYFINDGQEDFYRDGDVVRLLEISDKDCIRFQVVIASDGTERADMIPGGWHGSPKTLSKYKGESAKHSSMWDAYL